MNRVSSLEGLPILECYSDGGMIGSKNPSALGVTWAWCHVVHPGLRAVTGSGVVVPADVGLRYLSNHLAEFAAAARCLRALPDAWSGPFYCDSPIALEWLFEGRDPEGLPPAWVSAARQNLRRLGAVEPVLIAGHPTKKDLAAGKKGELPVSRHNVWCDAECGRQSQAFLARLEQQVRG